MHALTVNGLNSVDYRLPDFGTGEKLRFKAKIAAAMVALLASTGVTAASPANASMPGCQTSWLEYDYRTSSGGRATWSRNCSGSYGLNSLGYELRAGGWSGQVLFSNGANVDFCDWDVIPLERYRVTHIYISATKTTYCKNRDG
ncbi:hypothetical protein [Nonomuraea sp. NPDC049709]|uniref:hypothetical protein n=1 Tax=Nonomuraea sp. NPDC049709 TaxID=3154736 RepID=UPI00344757E9